MIKSVIRADEMGNIEQMENVSLTRFSFGCEGFETRIATRLSAILSVLTHNIPKFLEWKLA